jgi:hypothetical protein
MDGMIHVLGAAAESRPRGRAHAKGYHVRNFKTL